MFQIRVILSLCVTFGILIAGNIVRAEESLNEVPLGKSASSDVSKANEWSWTKEEWQSQQVTYQEIRRYIDGLIEKGQDPVNIENLYYEQSRNWVDPEAQFRWAYAAYEAARKVEFVDQNDKLQQISTALQKAAEKSMPHSPEYDRLRFLAMARLTPRNQLKVIGERLVAQYPTDYELRYYLVKVLSPGIDIADKELGITHIQALIKGVPQKPAVYALVGELYFKIWLKSKSTADAKLSIDGYRKFLELAPKGHPFRKNAEGLIQLMKE